MPLTPPPPPSPAICPPFCAVGTISSDASETSGDLELSPYLGDTKPTVKPARKPPLMVPHFLTPWQTTELSGTRDQLGGSVGKPATPTAATSLQYLQLICLFNTVLSVAEPHRLDMRLWNGKLIQLRRQPLSVYQINLKIYTFRCGAAFSKRNAAAPAPHHCFNLF
jgi:hypothetical protein